MVLKKLFLFVCIFVVVPAYFLYTPIPDEYSTMSACKMQLTLAAAKMVGAVATLGSVLGVASFTDIYREMYHSIARHLDVPDADVQETDLVFDGVAVRMYEPVKRSGVLPGVVYYHGGGFVFGNLDTAAGVVRKLCKETNSAVVSVDYRCAPEAIYPAAFDDSLVATKYFLSNARTFGVDPHRVAVAGDSAGGNLATTISLKLRDEKFEPSVKMQVLIYPFLQALDMQLPSYIQYRHGPLLSHSIKAFFLAVYLDGNDERLEAYLNNDHVSPAVKKMKVPYIDVSQLPSKYLDGYEKPSVETGNETMWNELKAKLLNPYFSPLVAERLDGLPLTYLFTAEHDALRDDGFLYAYRLKNSGVKVEHVHSDISIHASLTVLKALPEVHEMYRSITDFIKNNL